MISMYEDIKYYYDRGFYTKDNVKIFVVAEWITEEEYKQITGDDYAPAA